MIRLSILSLITVLAGVSTLSASETSTMTFGYCGDPQITFGTAWTEYTALVEFPKQFTEKFDGAHVTTVQIASPDNFEDPTVNNFIDFDLSFYHEIGGEAFYVQPCKFGDKALTWYDFKLDTPLEIKKDEPFFVGYSGLAPTIDDTCFAVDFVGNDDELGLWLGYIEYDSGEYVWKSYTGFYGNLCLRLVIEGDNLPKDEMAVNDLYVPSYIHTGKQFSASISLTNEASNDIESFNFIYNIGSASETVNVSVNPPLVYNETRDIVIPGLVCDYIGNRIPMDYKIADINGNPDCTITDTSDHDVIMLSMPDGTGYDRNVLVEEGTGTWCGWCPMGIVGMANMSEEYMDGTFIPVAIHHDDQMESPTYNAIDTEYFSAFPSVIVNRDTYRFGVILEPRYEMLKAAYLFSRSIPAIAKIEMEAAFADADNKSVYVTTDSEFAISTGDTHHLEYAITQDGVGPYPQTNYFAGGGDGEMGGFENLPEITMWTYDDVARTLYQGDGLDNTPGHSYQKMATLDLSDLESTENLRIVAMIVNDQTGEVENAVMGTIGAYSSVESVKASSYCIGADGAVRIAGLDSAEVYAADGTLKGIINGDGELSVAPGIYVVKAGCNTWKVLVK